MQSPPDPERAGGTEPLLPNQAYPSYQPAPPWQHPQPLLPIWAQPLRRRASVSTVISYALIAALSMILVLVASTLADRFGPVAVTLCGLLALVPLGICVTALLWVDRWEPEPRGALWLAFLWGAAAAIGLTLWLGPEVTQLLASNFAALDPQVLGAVIQAPFVEETFKCAGVVLIFFLRRKTFHGPIDGIVYAGLVGAGFAFTENILYFGNALLGSGTIEKVTNVFVLRGLLSPFAHVMFTGAFGLIVGLAATTGRTPVVIICSFAGVIPAIAGHMLWNGSPLLAGSFLGMYILLQVPLFIVAVITVVLLRRHEARRTHQFLREYARAGWFTTQEVDMLATPRGRIQAVAWAKSFHARPQMKAFVRKATHLAQTRQRIHTGINVGRHQADERRLLTEVTTARRELFTQLQPPPAY